MTRDLQRLIDGEAKIGVDLDHAAPAAEIAREGAPRLVRDEFEPGLLARWQRQCATVAARQASSAASITGCSRAAGREPRRERGVAIDQPIAAADQVRDLGTNRREVRLVDRPRRDPEEARALLREGWPGPCQHIDAGDDRREIAHQRLDPHPLDRIGIVTRPDPRGETSGVTLDRRQRRRAAANVGDGIRRARIEIKGVGIALAKRHRQADVLPRVVVKRERADGHRTPPQR